MRRTTSAAQHDTKQFIFRAKAAQPCPLPFNYPRGAPRRDFLILITPTPRSHSGEETEKRQDGQYGRYLATVVFLLLPATAESQAEATSPAAADRPVNDRESHQFRAHGPHRIQRRRAVHEPPLSDTKPNAE